MPCYRCRFYEEIAEDDGKREFICEACHTEWRKEEENFFIPCEEVMKEFNGVGHA